MKKLFLFVFPLLLAGCCFNSSSSKTEYFSVDTPQANAKYNYNIKLGDFDSDGLYGTKMVFTREPHSISFDSFNKWAQTPEKMIATYFYLFFNAPNGLTVEAPNGTVELSSDIIKFDCNLTSKKAVLYIKVTAVNSLNGNVLFSDAIIEEQPLKSLTAFSFAESMGEALHSVAVKIEEKLNVFYKINNNQ